jgi:hypothetical protein
VLGRAVANPDEQVAGELGQQHQHFLGVEVAAVKLAFFRGAALKDPAGLFNASLGGKVRRAIDIHDGDKIDEPAFKALIQEAVAQNLKRKKKSVGSTRRRRCARSCVS